MFAEIAGWNADELLGASETEVAEYLADRHSTEQVELHREDRWADEPEEITITFEGTFGTHVAPGTRVRFHVPFSGDRLLLFLTPSQYSFNYPVAGVGTNELVVVYEERNLDASMLATRLTETLDLIEQWLVWGHGQVERHNASLFDSALGQIRERKARILKDRDEIASLGVPVKRRSDAPAVAVPLQRRRPKLDRPQPSGSTEYRPEPALNQTDFDLAVLTLAAACRQLERSPTTTLKLDEEERRDLLLVSLNGQFEGQAGGEVFNGAGKTDILLRVEDRNVFIVECKIWTGAAALSKAIDQLVGYLVWRDTKAVLVVFIERKHATDAIEKAVAAVVEHERCIRQIASDREDCYEFVLVADDEKREIHLTLLPVVVQEP